MQFLFLHILLILPIIDCFHSKINVKFHQPIRTMSIQCTTNTQSIETFPLYIGNLPLSLTMDEFQQFLVSNGITNGFNHRLVHGSNTKFRGFGYVDFKSQQELAKGAELMIGLEIQGRILKVDQSNVVNENNKGTKYSKISKEISAFVANLPFALSNEELNEIIQIETGSKYLCKVRISQVDGRSKGYGFIDFETIEARDAVIQALTGINILDRLITVEIAQKYQSPSTSTYSGEVALDFSSTKKSVRTEPINSMVQKPTNITYSLFVTNLPKDVTAQNLLDKIEDVMGKGTIDKIRLAYDLNTMKFRGFGHIDFVDQKISTWANQKLNGLNIDGFKIKTDLAENHKKKTFRKF